MLYYMSVQFIESYISDCAQILCLIKQSQLFHLQRKETLATPQST